MTRYRVAHTTTYHYRDEVSASYGQVHLLPRDTPAQRCETSSVAIDPEPHDYRERYDFFGNRVGYFEILAAHRKLSVSTTSWVDVAPERRHQTVALAAHPARDLPWESARVTPGVMDAAACAEGDDGVEFVLDSPLVATSGDLAAYGAVSFLPGRPVVEALQDLTERIHSDFPYKPGATGVTTTAAQVLAKGEGVCQDFAHLAIGCLRSLGLGARYVSGYLETFPPPGRPRLTGADVSHAWAAALVPGVGWLEIDPTNRQFANDRYVVAAWGRDYTDVPPLKGVIFTEGTKHDLEVMVDVVRLDDGAM